jgi:hypothetical protein
MSLYPPPREDEAIFNPVNWEESSEGGLTQQQADQRYLFKTQNDTELGLINFTTGMNIDNIQSFTGNIAIGTSGTANTITIGSANSNVFIYGNVTAIDVQNLVVKDKAITVNKDGITPLGAGLEVESSNVIVSSMLCDANGDFVFTSGNNRIYLDELQTITGNITTLNSNILVQGASTSIRSEIHPSFICINNGVNVTGFQLLANAGCAGTLNELDFQIKTNNINRIDVDGANGNVTISSTTESTSASTGSLRTLGGLGVAGNVFVGGNITGGNLITNGALVTTGNLGAGNIFVTGVISSSGNITGGNLVTSRNVVASGNISGGNISTVAELSVGTNMTVTGQANVTGVFNCGSGVGQSSFNYNNIQLLGSNSSSSGIIRFTRTGSYNYLQTSQNTTAGNALPLVIGPLSLTERWMTITRSGTGIGNVGVISSFNSNLYVLGNAIITSNLLVQSNIIATSRLDAPTSIIGNSSAYGVFLNTSVGTGNIGVSIENSVLGNTIIQPQHQGVAWRNTYLNPNGGIVSIGSATPPNATDELYVNGTANINGGLFVVNDANVLNQTVRGNLTVLGNGLSNINGNLFIVNDANVLNQTVRGNLTVLGNVTSSPVINGNLFVSGNANIRQNANIGGILRIESTQGTFATGNGALVVSGGVGIGADINMGGNLNAGGALISASNTSEALRIIGGGTMTGTMVANQFTGNNVVSGNLVIGGGALSEGVKCCIRNNVVDIAVNGTTLGNAINLIEMENGTRSWYFGTSGASQDEFYIGSSNGAGNEPDYNLFLNSTGQMMNYPASAGAITAPNATDLYTCRGNANISANLTVVGNIISKTEIFTPALEISGTGGNVLWVGGDANILSANIRGPLTINSGASGPGAGNVTITNDFNNANLNVNGPIYASGAVFQGAVVVGSAGPLNRFRCNSIQFGTTLPTIVIEKGINASGVNAITFTTDFNATPTLQITPVDTTSSAVTATIVNIDSNGANVNFKNSANSTISRPFHWLAVGNVAS